MSLTQITTGSFTSTASTPFFIPLSQQISKFSLVNQTKLASYTSGRITNAEWNNYMGNGIAIVDAPTTITGPLNVSAVIRTQLAQNGFTIVKGGVYQQGATKSILSFTPGATTEFTTSAAHGFLVGDNVRIVGMTTAPEMGGLVMTVTAVGSTTTFTTLFNSTNSLTSVGSVYKVGNASLQNSSLYYPQFRAIAGITLASTMVVTTLVKQNYAVGDVVRFQIPTVFGMTQLNSTTNGLPVEFTVVAVNNAVGAQTVSLNVDSSAFTAFAWPLAASYPFSLPVMVPQGEGNTNNISQFGVNPNPLPYANQNVLSFAQQNTAQSGILIGAGDGTAAATTGGLIGAAPEVYTWTAVTAIQQFPQI